ncbi:MAG: hypothetical protein K1V75_06490 [Muribaculaceae bacterium]
MKRFMICAASIAMLGLVACSNKDFQTTDSLTDSVDVNVAEQTQMSVDSISPDSAVINVQHTVVETVTPIADSTAQK